MATYKGIQGFGVETLASDPTEPGSVGQIFYNSTSGTFKTVKPGGIAAGTWWTELNDLNTARLFSGSAGNTTAGLVFAGTPPGTNVNTESWDGTSWTEVSDLNTGGWALGGSGTQTDALAFGGGNFPTLYANTEYWNGTSWTEVADLATARDTLGSAGLSATASLAFGGRTAPTTFLNATEEWLAPDIVINTLTTS
jgi:hypothetical protein